MNFSDLNAKQRFTLIVAAIGIVYMLVIATQTFQGMSPTNMFIVLTLTVYAGIAWILSRGHQRGVIALIGIACMIAAMDLALPPHFIDFTGHSTATGLAQASIDSALHAFATQANIPTNLVWWAVYPLAFLVLMAVGIQLTFSGVERNE